MGGRAKEGGRRAGRQRLAQFRRADLTWSGQYFIARRAGVKRAIADVSTGPPA